MLIFIKIYVSVSHSPLIYILVIIIFNNIFINRTSFYNISTKHNFCKNFENSLTAYMGFQPHCTDYIVTEMRE